MDPQDDKEVDIPDLQDPALPPSYSGKYTSDLFWLIGLVMIAFTLFFFIGKFYMEKYYGSAAFTEGIGYILEKFPNDLRGLRIYQMMSTVILFLLPPLVYSRLCCNKPMNYLGLDKRPPLRDLWILPGMIMSFYPLMALMYFFNQQLVLPEALSELESSIRQMEKDTEQLVIALLKTNDIAVLIMNMVLIAVLPAICEEIFFRGALQRIFYGIFKNPHIAILIVGVIFSFFHFQFFSFLPRMALGILFGYLFWWSGSLWTPIFAHLINNAWQVYASYMYYNGELDVNLDEVDVLPVSATGMSMMVFLVLCYLYYQAARLSQKPANNA